MGYELERERAAVLSRLIRFIAIAGIVAYLPGVIAGVVYGLWAIVVVDTITYAAIIIVAFLPGSSADLKLIVLITVSLATGAVLLLYIGSLGAGYIWFIFPVVLSALFGKDRFVALAIAVTMGFMLCWGIALSLGAEGYGATPWNVVIISGSILVICLALSMVIKRLLSSLSAALAEKGSLAERLALELRDTNVVRMELERTLATKDELLRELHHRVRNNLQVVQSLLSIGDEPSGHDSRGLEDARRRIKALSAANDIFLSRPELSLVDGYDLIRSVAHLSMGRDRDDFCRIDASDASRAALDEQTAAVVAVLFSDLVAALSISIGVPSIHIEGRECRFRLDIHYDGDGGIDASAVESAFRSVAGGRIATGAAPEITIGFIDPGMRFGPGIYLEASSPAL